MMTSRITVCAVKNASKNWKGMLNSTLLIYYAMILLTLKHISCHFQNNRGGSISLSKTTQQFATKQTDKERQGRGWRRLVDFERASKTFEMKAHSHELFDYSCECLQRQKFEIPVPNPPNTQLLKKGFWKNMYAFFCFGTFIARWRSSFIWNVS